jgi:hypothetical protein
MKGIEMHCTQCEAPAAGKSKYCTTHRAEARARFKAMCEESKVVAAQRDTAHSEVFTRTQYAATEAFKACDPTPMVVYEAEGLTDRPKDGGKAWYVGEGVCGFASVIITPATSSFAKWLNRSNIGHKNYGGGWHVSVYNLVEESKSSQSYERKVAAARAAVQVLKDAGISAYVWDRLD